MELFVNYRDGVQFEVASRGHRIVCDQPVEGGGADAGMTPPELLLASLGTCAGYYAAQYLKARGLAPSGLRIAVKAQKASQPARLASFSIQVEAPAASASERHAEGLRRAVEKCLIHNTLLHAPAIAVEVLAPVAA